MADIHCRHCGEPWDHDELHDMAGHMGSPRKVSYDQAGVRFALLGCGAFDMGDDVCNNAVCDPDAADRAAWSHEVFEHPEEWS